MGKFKIEDSTKLIRSSIKEDPLSIKDFTVIGVKREDNHKLASKKTVHRFLKGLLK